MATPACSICLHRDVQDIDAALLTGTAIIPTACRHGVSKSALGRHKLNCLAPKMAAAAKIVQPVRESREVVERARSIVGGGSPSVSDVLTLSNLVSRLSRSLERLEQAADNAADGQLHSALTAVSGQLHRGVETAAKLQGLYVEPVAQQRSTFSIKIIFPEGARSSCADATAAIEP